MTIKNENVIITPARLCHEQRISLVPIAHHYEAPENQSILSMVVLSVNQ
jgi:hypothetical protein